VIKEIEYARSKYRAKETHEAESQVEIDISSVYVMFAGLNKVQND